MQNFFHKRRRVHLHPAMILHSLHAVRRGGATLG